MQDAKKRMKNDWESAVEKQIREAIDRGEFENLPGRGRPLDLSREPHTPPEWELAFKLLKDAGFVPEWIELDKEIRAAKTKILETLKDYAKTRSGRQTGSAEAEARLTAEFRRGAQELNRKIDDFNLRAPSPRLHHARIRIDEEIARFNEAIAKGQE